MRLTEAKLRQIIREELANAGPRVNQIVDETLNLVWDALNIVMDFDNVFQQGQINWFESLEEKILTCCP